LRNVGITVPAKRHRTAQDLPALMKLPGRIRLVKGAFLEPEGVAHARHSPGSETAYRRYAQELLLSGHKCSIATHDRSIQANLVDLIVQERIDPRWFEFESLIGLAPNRSTPCRHAASTREYRIRAGASRAEPHRRGTGAPLSGAY
jgi:proline dehydrogenase